ncbi:MAG: hypothetical protein QMD09_01735 [Desulfatibacillaceae bacterium]|jgi:hypothetical protein|nr:hypothetical protein [Desulfatibacillaceae bacterium]
MPYDPEQDKVLKQWKSEETGLLVSINQYAASEPKLQIGPREFAKKDGSVRQGKAGRLTVEDVQWLYENIDEIKEALVQLVPPR